MAKIFDSFWAGSGVVTAPASHIRHWHERAELTAVAEPTADEQYLCVNLEQAATELLWAIAGLLSVALATTATGALKVRERPPRLSSTFGPG